MISTTAEYALRVVTLLARQGAGRHKTPEIAEATRVPAAYLSKVIQALAQAGLIDSRRGRNGGVSLARVPEELTILEVVQAVDPPLRIRECPLGPDFHGENLCPLHHRLDEAAASMEKALGRSTLAEVLAEPSSSQPLCKPKRKKRPRVPGGKRTTSGARRT